jgi:hypothetical protein
MIKLKDILVEAGVFDSPDTWAPTDFSAEKSKAAIERGVQKSGELWQEPPYDNVMEQFMELDPDDQEQRHNELINQYEDLLISYSVVAETLYGKNGIERRILDTPDEDNLTGDLDIMDALYKQKAGLKAQAEEIEIVLAYMMTDLADEGLEGTAKPGPEAFDANLAKLQKEREDRVKEFIKSETARKAEKRKEVQKSEKQGEEAVKKDKEAFADRITKGLEDGSLSAVPLMGDAELKRYAKDISKAESAYKSFIAQYGDDEQAEAEELLDKLKAVIGKSDKQEEGMIKLKPLIEANIDIDKVFMKGRTQKRTTDEPEKAAKEVEDALKILDRDIKKVDLEPKKVDEALGLTLAGVALSLPAIISMIGKFVNVLKRIPGLKSLSGDKLIAIGDKYHHKIINGITIALKKIGVKDSIKAKKFANFIYHIIIAMLLIGGVGASYKAASQGNIVGSTLKSTLNAIKTGELRAYITKVAAGI